MRDANQPKAVESPPMPQGQRSPNPLPVPDDVLLIETVAELGLAERSDVSHIKHTLKAHAAAFALGRLTQARYPTVHADAKHANALANAIDASLRALAAMNPLHQMTIAVTLHVETEGELRLESIKHDLAVLQAVAGRFASGSFAKKQKDETLRNAVGGLMILLEELTGHRARVRVRDSVRGFEPELTSPAAQAIGKLLRVAQPDLLTTTLVNVIASIRRKAGKGSLSEFAHLLLLGGTVRPF